MHATPALALSPLLLLVLLPVGALSQQLEPVTPTLYLQVCNESIIRVLALPAPAFPTQPSLVVREQWPEVDYTVEHEGDVVILTTSRLKAVANKSSGQVSFYDGDTLLLAEQERAFINTTDMGKPALSVLQSWGSFEDEAIYGLGQYQNGIVDYKHAPIEMVQFNTEAVVPFLVSTRGHGILWDAYSWTHFNPASEEIIFTPDTATPIVDGTGLDLLACKPGAPLQQWTLANEELSLAASSPSACLDCNGCAAGTQAHMWHCDPSFAGNQDWLYDSATMQLRSKQVGTCLTAAHVAVAPCNPRDPNQQWVLKSNGLLQLANTQKCLTVVGTPQGHATFTSTLPGAYHFYIDMGHGFGAGFNGAVTLTINNASVQAWQGLTNLPDSLTGRVYLQANTTYRLELTSSGLSTAPRVFVQYPDYNRTTFLSDVADAVDYYFMYGGSIDASIALYRTATGPAPLFGIWAYGFWQCKERYHNQTELLDAATEFRRRQLPVDNIVQDWHYWGNEGWGPQWDPSIYPDPAGMVQQLKRMHYHFMVSVWSKFDDNTEFYAILRRDNQLIPNSIWFDPYNPAARTQFYNFSNVSMFSIGVDALWLDATEPEFFPNENQPVYLGSGNKYMNPYSLLVTAAVTDGLQRDRPDMRVFSLTRSSFAGQQRTGGVLWSGDIAGTWDSLRRQISASINYQASGIPHWSEDIGGFFRPGDQYTSPDYHELLIRWFQFGTFTPIFRVHGGGTNTEYWNFGDDVVANVLQACQLRYRLLPYIYTLGWQVHAQHATTQRLLAFDFPSDPNVFQIADQFLFGPAFLVAPVYAYQQRSRSVYLPAVLWWDFWTGSSVAGGVAVTAAAPINQMPLFVRAGAIVLMGPFLQYSQELPADPLEVRVYGGQSGRAPLYEDDGLSQAFAQRGESTLITFSYDAPSRKFSVSARQGSFPGMLSTRTLHVVLVAPGHGVGLNYTASPDVVVTYTGDPLEIQL